MAPWRHAHITPQGQRRMCCVSEENRPAFESSAHSNGQRKFVSETFEDFWNSAYLKSIRIKMLGGEKVPECIRCDEESGTVHSYRDRFTSWLFQNDIDAAFENTAEDGSTSLEPHSFDYRFSNHCNFKCRICGPEASSAWEIEVRKNELWKTEEHPWLEQKVSDEIKKFQIEVVEEEFARALRKGIIKEIYWAGGEPLAWDLHWKYMKELVDRDLASNTLVRYNTNLYKIEDKGIHLFRDLLSNFDQWELHASIDGAGAIGEYIRSGLNWNKFVKNLESALEYPHARERICMDLTITGPGLFSIKELLETALRLDVRIEAKHLRGFRENWHLSPFIWPRNIFLRIMDDLILFCENKAGAKQRPLVESLHYMRSRPSIEIDSPNFQYEFQTALDWHKKIEKIRGNQKVGTLNLKGIFSQDAELFAWWQTHEGETVNEEAPRIESGPF